jgi:hypothetical protein
VGLLYSFVQLLKLYSIYTCTVSYCIASYIYQSQHYVGLLKSHDVAGFCKFRLST